MRRVRSVFPSALFLLVPLFLGIGVFTHDAAAQAQPEAAQQVFAPAPVEQQAPPTFFTALTDLLPVIVLCYGIFYFMVIKPQE